MGCSTGTKKVLITGATGKIAFPDRAGARRAQRGVGRGAPEGTRQTGTNCGGRHHTVRPRHGRTRLLGSARRFRLRLPCGGGHRSPATGHDASRRTRTIPVRCLHHCRTAKGFVFCSTGSIYGYQGRRPLREDRPARRTAAAELQLLEDRRRVGVHAGSPTATSIPLTIIRICSTYGPEGGAPADRLDAMLAGKPIRLHPDKPNNYNPIYEDDYVELGIRAMEVAATPPIVVNWAGSETVSVEDYCTYMGELVGVEPIFEYTPDAHTPLWPDVTHMHEVLGRTKVPWREGFRRMIAGPPSRNLDLSRRTTIDASRNPVRRGRRCPRRRPRRDQHPVRLHGHGAIPRAATPSTCAGTPSTTGPSSTGWPACAPRCGWCRRRPAGPHGRAATSASTRSTT